MSAATELQPRGSARGSLQEHLAQGLRLTRTACMMDSHHTRGPSAAGANASAGVHTSVRRPDYCMKMTDLARRPSLRYRSDSNSRSPGGRFNVDPTGEGLTESKRIICNRPCKPPKSSHIVCCPIAENKIPLLISTILQDLVYLMRLPRHVGRAGA